MGKRYNRIKKLVREDRIPYIGKRNLTGGWRKKIISESDWTPVTGSIANSTSQTFVHSTGATTTISGLGGVETTPSTVTIDAFGDRFDVPAPEYGQYGMQGYAPPLGGVQRQTQQSENGRIDAEIRKLEEQIKESKAKETAAIDAWNAELLATMNRHAREWEAVLKKDGVYNPEKHKGLQARHDAEIEAVWDKEPKTKPYETERQNLRVKITELEKQRPINQQLDASQQAYPNLPMMNARVQSAVGARQSSFSTSDTSQDDRVKPVKGNPWEIKSGGPKYSSFGPFRDDQHFENEASRISERYRKKIEAIYNYYSSGAGSYRTMKPVMDIEAERDSILRDLYSKKTKQDQDYTKAVDQYGKKLEAEKLARRAAAGTAPGGVPLQIGQPAVGTSPNESVPTPDDDVLDQVASLPGLASAKNFVDHYIDNFVLGDGKQDQNLTNLLSKDDLNYLKNALGKDSGINNPKINRLSAPNSLYTIMQNAPRGIRNSIGNGSTLDVDYFNRTGDYKIDKDYVFTQEADLEYRGLPGNALFKPLIDAPKNYAKLKMGGDISPLIQNPMRFHVIIPGPRRKKKKEEELGESTWSKLKKHR